MHGRSVLPKIFVPEGSEMSQGDRKKPKKKKHRKDKSPSDVFLEGDVVPKGLQETRNFTSTKELCMQSESRQARDINDGLETLVL